jgi:DNA-binding transcriptional LysR family regulator
MLLAFAIKIHNCPHFIPAGCRSVTPRRFHQLQAFVAVMQSGSVSRAAEALLLTQPAVTKLLRALEAETGLTLFDRRRRRLVPTHEARRFEQEAARLFVAARQVDRLANTLRGAGLGELRVAAMPSLGIGFVPRLLGRFAKQAEGLRVAMTVTSSIEVHELVQSGQVDLGVIHPLASAEGMLAAPPITLRGVLALPPRHRLAKRRKVELRELDGEPQVVLGRQYRLRDLVEDAFSRHGAAPVVVAETQNAAAACQMVAEGLGFTIVDAVTAASYVGRLRLAELVPKVDIPVQVLAPPGRPVSTIAARFLELLLAELQSAASVA